MHVHVASDLFAQYLHMHVRAPNIMYMLGTVLN